MVPLCLINTDVNLLVFQVEKWNCLQEITLEDVKYFYLYCIILLSMQESLEDFRNILFKIFIITNSEFRNDTSLIFQEIKAKMIHLNILSMFNKEKLANLKDEFDDIFKFNSSKCLDYQKCQPIEHYIANILKEAKNYISINVNNRNEPNAFYNIEFCNCLKELCIEFPIWTRVMINESNNFEMKLGFLESARKYKEQFQASLTKDLTVDEYLIKNMDFTETKLEIARNSFTSRTKNQKNEKKKKDVSYIQHEENWMNKNNEEKSDNDDHDDDDDGDGDGDADGDDDSSSSGSASGDISESSVSDEIEFYDEDIASIIGSVCEQPNVKRTFHSSTNLSNDSMIIQCGNHLNENVLSSTVMEVCDVQNDIFIETTQDDEISFLDIPAHEIKNFNGKLFHQCQEQTSFYEEVTELRGNGTSTDISSIKIEDPSILLKSNKPASEAPNTLTSLFNNNDNNDALPKQRGKYLQPCQDIDLLEIKPLKKPKKRKIIKNYNRMKPKTVNKKKQYIKTSSYFDSILEILVSSYFSIEKFQNFINNSTEIVEGIKQEFLITLMS